MATDVQSLHIVAYPHPVLRERARPIESVDGRVREVAARMVELMNEAEGIGLAAPQVGLPWRMFVAHVPEAEDRSAAADPPEATPEPRVYINPTLTEFSRDLEPYDEGCLSLPGILGEVRRPSVATIQAIGLDGEPFTERAHGLLARCWQHENDHLDGVLIIDRMTQVSKAKCRSAIKDLERRAPSS